MPVPAARRAAALLLAAVSLTALTGCIANPPNAAAPQTPTSAEGTAPAPTPAAEAPPAWTACVASVEDAYPDVDPDAVVPYEQGDVRDGEGGGAVVDVEVGAEADGTAEQAFTCTVSGTPESPVVDQVAPVAG